MPLHRQLRVLAALILTLAVSGSAQAALKSGAASWAELQKSLVIVGYKPADGPFVSYGTGFCIDSDGSNAEFLTDNHVVVPPNSSKPLSLFVEVATTHAVIPARIVRQDASIDLALVSAQVPSMVKLSISSDPPQSGDGIAAGGFPWIAGTLLGGLMGSQLQLQGAPTVLAPEIHFGHVTTLQPQWVGFVIEGGTIDHGDSGGPLFDPDSGLIYGEMEGFIPGSTGSNGQDPAVATAYMDLAMRPDTLIAFRDGKSQAAALPNYVKISAVNDSTTVFRVAAAQQNAEAMNILGLMYRDGTNGLERNPAQAAQWFQQAADQGNANGANNLGVMLLNGLSVAQDYAKALHYFQLAAQQKNGDAESNIGYIYEYGLGVAKNDGTALQHFQSSAALGSAKGEANLGYLYANGIGVPRDDAKALAEFQLSAAQGDAFGESNLGWMYDPRRNSIGVKADYDVAEGYYKQSAQQITGASFYEGGPSPEGVSIVKLVQVGENPQSAAITPNGREVYVTNRDSQSVSVIDTASDRITHTLQVGVHPKAIVVSRDGRYVYVGNNDGGGVSVIDTAGKTVSSIVTNSPSVRDVAVTPDGRRLFLAMEYAGLEVVDLQSRAVQQVSTIECPEGLAITRDGKKLYVNYQCYGPGGRAGHDALAVFDLDPAKPCAAGNTTGCNLAGAIQGFPNVGGDIAISPDGSQLWLSGNDACSQPAYDHAGCAMVPGSVVNVIDPSAKTLVKTMVFRPGEGNGSIAFPPTGDIVFIGGGTLLKVIDWRNMAFLEPLPVSSAGLAAFAPDGSGAFLPVPEKNAIAVIKIAKPAVPRKASYAGAPVLEK